MVLIIFLYFYVLQLKYVVDLIECNKIGQSEILRIYIYIYIYKQL
jgi:hypothetical protein